MPLLAHGVDAISADGLVAAGALGARELVEVSLAVGLAVALEEDTAREGLQTLGADEVVDVPLLANGSDALIRNGLVAVGTLTHGEQRPTGERRQPAYLGTEHALIATLTVRSAVELKVGLLTDRLLKKRLAS
jgi:hypothetical protein